MVQPRLLAILSEQLYYDEIAIPFTRMQNECKQLISLLADSNIDLQDRLHCSVFTIDQANELVSLHSTRQNTTHNCRDSCNLFPLFVWISCKLILNIRAWVLLMLTLPDS